MFQMFLDNIPFPIWIKDKDMKFTYVNNYYTKLYNKQKQDFLGLKNEDVFSIETSKKYNLNCEDVINSREAKVYETYINNKYCQCCIFPIIDDNENVVSIVGLIGLMNLDKLEEKNRELEAQKDLTNKIIDILPGIIFYKDLDSRYVYANESCIDFYKTKGIYNVIGKTDKEIQDDNEIAKKFLKDDKYIIETKETIHNEAIITDGYGKKLYREVVKMPLLDEYGNIKGIVGRSVDVTEKRNAEEKLKYLSYTDILTGVQNRTSFEKREKELSFEEFMPLGLIMGDANGLKLVNDTFGHVKGDDLLKKIAEILKAVCGQIGEVFRIGGDEFIILIPNTSRKQCEEIIKKIINACENYESEMFKISISLGAAIKEDVNEDIYDILTMAEDKVYRQKLLKKGSIKGSILESLKVGLGVKSMETEEHTHRVSQYAILVGKKLDLEISELDELEIVGELHDIGKIGISEEILLKPSELTEEEYEIMKTHTEKGYRIIKASSELENIARGVLYHHERWDGKGYPRGLKGEEIPLIARIISVVDAYDVMTNDRVYKKSKSKEDAIDELNKCSGMQFDPNIVDIFIKCIQ